MSVPSYYSFCPCTILSFGGVGRLHRVFSLDLKTRAAYVRISLAITHRPSRSLQSHSNGKLRHAQSPQCYRWKAFVPYGCRGIEADDDGDDRSRSDGSTKFRFPHFKCFCVGAWSIAQFTISLLFFFNFVHNFIAFKLSNRMRLRTHTMCWLAEFNGLQATQHTHTHAYSMPWSRQAKHNRAIGCQLDSKGRKPDRNAYDIFSTRIRFIQFFSLFYDKMDMVRNEFLVLFCFRYAGIGFAYTHCFGVVWCCVDSVCALVRMESM